MEFALCSVLTCGESVSGGAVCTGLPTLWPGAVGHCGMELETYLEHVHPGRNVGGAASEGVRLRLEASKCAVDGSDARPRLGGDHNILATVVVILAAMFVVSVLLAVEFSVLRQFHVVTLAIKVLATTLYDCS